MKNAILIFTLIILILLDVVFIWWILQSNSAIDDVENTESFTCPSFFCKDYLDTTTGETKRGTPCFTEDETRMVAFRYNDDGKIKCQTPGLDYNVIIDGYDYGNAPTKQPM